ncbi:hypothetical protein [Nocardia huaxiensis]|uniref:hypothetical protein n=1 Tax=Nocardia huaxiensis TaxID=2755382 RepID=UPI001E487974|nr:hypothetical protein [Nocardia huaxiensis]UFS94341.1 hypothetical protein LPY97_26730 [Nocardia huaxiensis]
MIMAITSTGTDGTPSWVSSAAWNRLTGSGIAQPIKARATGGSGNVYNHDVKDGAAAVQLLTRIRNAETLTLDSLAAPAKASPIGLPGPALQSPADPGGPGGTSPTKPDISPEMGILFPGLNPNQPRPNIGGPEDLWPKPEKPSTDPNPVPQQPAVVPQQPAQQQAPNSQQQVPQSGQQEAASHGANQSQPVTPAAVVTQPAGADEHIFGLPVIGSHVEGDTWEEILPNGIRRVNTIPIGNGTNTVDQVIYNADGTITFSRVVANGRGGYQRWNNDSTGKASYLDKETAEAEAYIQSFQPGSSTSGAPDRISGATSDWSEPYGNSYDSNGVLVGATRGLRNEFGLYNNVHTDLLGNRSLTLVSPNGQGGVNSRLAMQVDSAGDGWFIDDKNRQWSVFSDSNHQFTMQRIEKTSDGVHAYRINHQGVTTHEFTPKSGKSEDWYRDTTTLDGYTSRLLANFTVIKLDPNGKEIERTERPDGLSNWEKAVLGPASVVEGLAKAGWTLISYPVRKVHDSMRAISSIRVTDTGVMTTYQPPDRESEVVAIAMGTIMPVVGLVKYTAGQMTDAMAGLSSMRVMPNGSIGTTYQPPDRAGELLQDVTGRSREVWKKDPWGSATATATMVALMFVGPKGRSAPPRLGTSLDIGGGIAGSGIVASNAATAAAARMVQTAVRTVQAGGAALGKTTASMTSSVKVAVKEVFRDRPGPSGGVQPALAEGFVDMLLGRSNKNWLDGKLLLPEQAGPRASGDGSGGIINWIRRPANFSSRRPGGGPASNPPNATAYPIYTTPKGKPVPRIDVADPRLKRPLKEHSSGGEKFFVDANGVPHKIGARGDNPDAEAAFSHLNNQLRQAGRYYHGGGGSGSRYYFQADPIIDTVNPIRGDVPKAVIADTVTGTTADMIRVTWKDGKIVEVRSVDATGSPVFGPLGDIFNTIDNKLAFNRKYQTQEVVFVAASEAQAQMVFANYANNPNVRVIHPPSGFDKSGR